MPNPKSFADLSQCFTPDALRRRFHPIPTPWPLLDQKLFGLTPGLYILGAISSLGKSTFALQLAEFIACRDKHRPVLYFSLEMSQEAIAAKAMARYIFTHFTEARYQAQGLQKKKPNIHSNDLLFRKENSTLLEEYAGEIEEARQYLAGIPNFYIYTAGADDPADPQAPLTADRITELVNGYRKGKAFPVTPLVVVDYLQIIPAPKDSKEYRDSRAGIDLNIQKLRNIEGAAVLVISSLNRDAYYEPIGMGSFKESGGIEYSADVLLGLEFTDIRVSRPTRKDGPAWLDAQKKQDIRRVDISILKQRYGESNVQVSFRYYAAWDYFQQAGRDLADEPIALPELPVEMPIEASESPDTALPAPGPSSDPTQDTPALTGLQEPAKREAKKRSFKMNNSRLANCLRFFQTGAPKEYDPAAGVLATRPFPREAPELVTWLDDPYRVPGKDPSFTALTYWDMMVADAVFTFYQELWGDQSTPRTKTVGAYAFTANDLLRRLTGSMKKPDKPGKAQGAVHRSLQKLMGMRVRIHCAEELLEHAKKDPGRDPDQPVPQEFSGEFLRLWTEDRALSRGAKTKRWYCFFDPMEYPEDQRQAGPPPRLHMPLYQYVMYTNHVLDLPLERLATPVKENGKELFSDSVETLTVKHFILRGAKLAGWGAGNRKPSLGRIGLDTPEGLFTLLGIGTAENGVQKEDRRRQVYRQAARVLTGYRAAEKRPCPEWPERWQKSLDLRRR